MIGCALRACGDVSREESLGPHPISILFLFPFRSRAELNLFSPFSCARAHDLKARFLFPVVHTLYGNYRLYVFQRASATESREGYSTVEYMLYE